MEGLIYKVQPYQESSRLLFVFTPKGKVTLMARGAQKLKEKSRVLSQFLTHISFKEQINKKFYTLSEPKIINEFNLIKTDYHKTKKAALILEIIDQLVVDQVNYQFIFDDMILALNQSDITVSSLSFSLKILKPLGYELNLTADGRTIKGISIEKGGLVYQGEEESIDLNTKDALSLLKLYYLPYNEHGIYEIDILKRLEEFVQKYYQYHLHITLKNM
ncbi:MAG: DNA repair protein RecO [Acholeplasmataceae bacterium]|nr:DNA repair protein RecO [Acholeplasmataceae bacterium]